MKNDELEEVLFKQMNEWVDDLRSKIKWRKKSNIICLSHLVCSVHIYLYINKQNAYRSISRTYICVNCRIFHLIQWIQRPKSKSHTHSLEISNSYSDFLTKLNYNLLFFSFKRAFILSKFFLRPIAWNWVIN